ncbi:MAG: dihydrofolate reductase family protein [Longimicrobiales bacterium]|nr:dihydrofolate reductase family protein [Longimicrobiales bacterium]
MSDATRRIRYSVAMSLDGFIADRHGGYGWIVEESEIDFETYLEKIDTLVMGRGTYDLARRQSAGLTMFEGFDIHVVSTTLDPADVADATLISEDVEGAVRTLKEAPDDGPTKDIWLFGGGVLFRSLFEAGLVDRVEVAVIPVLLGEGVPVLPGLASDDPTTSAPEATPPAAPLTLHSTETFGSGIVLLKYDVT